jgi:ferrous iron transport protein A
MIKKLVEYANCRKKKNRNRKGFCGGIKTLCDLQPGSIGIIKKIGGNGAVKQRLLDLGITRETPIKVERTAPLGDPIEINVKGYYLAIRKDEAKFIEVEEKQS